MKKLIVRKREMSLTPLGLLVPQAERERQTAQVTAYLKAASALKASSASGAQDKAEGANDTTWRQAA